MTRPAGCKQDCNYPECACEHLRVIYAALPWYVSVIMFFKVSWAITKNALARPTTPEIMTIDYNKMTVRIEPQ